MAVRVTYNVESERITLSDGPDTITVPYREYENASEALRTEPQFRTEYAVFRTRYLLRKFLERQEPKDVFA